MLALISRTIKDNYKKLAANLIIAILFNWMFVSFFPSIHEEAEKFTELISSYPEGFLKAFGVDQQSLFIHLEGFLAVEYFSIMWPLIVLIFVVSLGTAAIAGEIEQGTIEMLLAQPLSRVKVFMAKYMSAVILLAVLTVVSIFSIIPFTYIYDVEYSFENYVSISVMGFLLALSIYSVTLLFSSVSSSRSMVTSLSAGLIILMYAANVMSALNESFEFLKYASFFYYYDYNAAIIDNQVDIANITTFIITILVTTGAALFTFRNRDLAT